MIEFEEIASVYSSLGKYQEYIDLESMSVWKFDIIDVASRMYSVPFPNIANNIESLMTLRSFLQWCGTDQGCLFALTGGPIDQVPYSESWSKFKPEFFITQTAIMNNIEKYKNIILDSLIPTGFKSKDQQQAIQKQRSAIYLAVCFLFTSNKNTDYSSVSLYSKELLSMEKPNLLKKLTSYQSSSIAALRNSQIPFEINTKDVNQLFLDMTNL